MQAGRPSGGGPKGDINVTPLVDVVLVLLIIFMVITPMLERGASVTLPIAEHPKKNPEVKEQITVSVTADGHVYWETNELPDDDLAARMHELHEKKPTTPIMIKGDEAANYGRVRRVMKIINDAGFESVGFITKEREKAHPAAS